MKESLRAEAEQRERALKEEKREVEAALGAAEANVRRQQTLVRGLARLLGDVHRRLWWQRRFQDWLGWAARRRQLRQLGRVMAHAGNVTHTRHAYTQWRLFACTRRESKFARAEESRWRCREAELLAEVEALKGLAEEERRRSDGLEERMKAAFVRGVCALNKEAVQVLRGTQTAAAAAEAEAGDEAGETGGAPRPRLYDARAVRLPSARTSHTPSTTARPEIPPVQRTATATTAPATTATAVAPVGGQEGGYAYHFHGVPQQEVSQATTCPAHPPALPGPPCHICYAPDSCAYNARASPHQPFVVSVDPAAVRSYGDTSVSQRPPHMTTRRSGRVEQRPRVSR
ncbi:uncharacterized protein Tco025E_04018 [Trypanosoma conorhini]|uniref:Centrosomal protein POC5 n=1 Tax=Trypanosoma conorhini TaxID=83891 RepID=A0A422PPI9_9TRYP|nr:uncharacterized protein Tco025E_04018 [Trypanosoma conorhini]RNF19641.1 hypothetical protein Tco025E_04018 [Trypanosoma conorhini]